jgi:F-type H+-transporting ATPase subunit b
MAKNFKALLLLVMLVLGLTVVPFALAQETATEPATSEEVQSEAAIGEDHAEEGTAGEEAAAEGEEGGNPLNALGINLGFLIGQIVNFGIIALLLGVALWGPLQRMLDSRTAKIQKGLEDAAAAANARRNAETEADKILSAARADAARVVEEARARGEEVARSVESEARTEAERIRAEGRTRSNEERDRQLADLRGQVASIAMAAAQRLIGESMDEKRQQTLVNEFFTRLPAEARGLTGDVEVISAMPLSAGEQDRVRQDLGAPNATFTVDPSILGGLVVRSADRVVDGSVRSGLAEMSGRLR